MKKRLFFVLIISLIVFLLLACEKQMESYLTTIGSGDDEIQIVVVHGTPFEMGYAMGKLLKEKIHACIPTYLKSVQNNDPDRFGDKNLDEAWESISPYIQKRFKDELNGLSEGAEFSLEILKRAHAVPVVGDFACSGIAVWGPACSDGHLYQIRNLDFVKDAFLQDYPLIIIYLPEDGIPHAVPTFAGYIGAHAGINAKGIVLGEKGASPGSDYPFDLNGTHFSTLFRDLLYETTTLDETLQKIKLTKLIKRYYLYVGDGKEKTMGAAKIQVSTPDSVKFTIWRDNDSNDEMAPYILENMIYFTMDNKKAFQHLSENNGKYDSDKMIELSQAVASKGGNLVNVVYDATDLEMWIAFAEKEQDACQRPYVHLSLKDYLK